MRYPGPWRAIVAENKDPQQLCRIKLEVPDVLGDIVSDWAPPMTLFTGSERDQGLYVVPEVGNRVWAFFEDCDPDKPVYAGSWPARPSAPDTADVVRGNADVTRSGKGTDVTVGASGSTASEPGDAYGGRYPENKAWKTASGHLIELDDTPGAERIHVFHTSGSAVEFLPNGSVVVRIEDEEYTVVRGDRSVHVGGNRTEAVDGDHSERIGLSQGVEIGASQELQVGGSRQATIGASVNETVGASKTETIGASRSVTVGGVDSLQATSSNVIIAALQAITAVTRQETFTIRNTVVAASDTETIGLNKLLTVGGAMQLSVAGVLTITANQIILNSSSLIIDNQPLPWSRS